MAAKKKTARKSPAKKTTAKSSSTPSQNDPPKNNEPLFKIAMRHLGRPRTFSVPEELAMACMEYFQWIIDNPLMEAKLTSYQGISTIEKIPKMHAMSRAGLCLHIGISETSWRDYRERDGFSLICEHVERTMYEQKFSGASADMLNASIIARDLGLVDKQETTTKNEDLVDALKTLADKLPV